MLASFSGLPPGTYNITITDAGGFTTDTSLTVLAPEPIVVSASNQADTILVSASGGTFSYEYSLDGINWQASPAFPGLPDGNYTAFARDIKLCTDSTEFVLNTVKTFDLETSWGLFISPNPGKGLFQLRMQHAPAVLKGDIFDMTGRLLHHMDYTPGQGVFTVPIDLQYFPQGMYILRLTDGLRAGAVQLSIVR